MYFIKYIYIYTYIYLVYMYFNIVKILLCSLFSILVARLNKYTMEHQFDKNFKISHHKDKIKT